MSEFQQQLEDLSKQFMTQINQIHAQLDVIQGDLNKVKTKDLDKILDEIYWAENNIRDLQSKSSAWRYQSY